MNRWVRISVPFAVDAPAIDEHAFEVLDELFLIAEVSTIRDPDVYVDLKERIVTLELLSAGPTDLDAVRSGLAAMRSAIHAAGGATHGWEDEFADLAGLTLFPTETPLADWEPTETKFSKVLIDA